MQLKITYPLIIFALVLLVYLWFAGRFQFVFHVTIYNYFSYLSEALLHKSLAFISIPPYLQDLSIVNGKIYMYWGPTTILPILPFVVLFGKDVSDILYTAIIASFNPLILYLIFMKLEKLKFIKLSNYKKILLTLFFAFGTVHFYLSINGAVWFTSQIISILFLLLAIYFIISFVDSDNVTELILSSLFFGFAVVSRESLIFNLPIFLAFILISYLRDKLKINLLKYLTVFFLIFILVFGVDFYYNYLRFGSFMDNGHSRHNYSMHFASDKEKFGIFNSIYIPKNLYYMFFNIPSFINKFPYFIFDKEGNSILFTSPLFLLVLTVFRKKYWRSTENKWLNSSLIISLLITILFLLNYFSTGWVQFGYRYLLDVLPSLMILLTIVAVDIPSFLIMTLFIFSVIMNTLGGLWFMYI